MDRYSQFRSIVSRLTIYASLLMLHALRVESMQNKIMNTPQVICAEKGIVFEMETSQPFKGQLYVRNEYRNPKCRASFKAEKSEEFVGGNIFQLNFNECGMRRQRMATPKGLSYSVTMVVQFHNVFVTSADKAYQIRCFYREYSMEVTAEQMNISPLTTVTMALDHPVPRCTYTIKYKSMDGPAASFVTIGDPVVHLFACDADDSVYRMLIKECYVDDGKEHKQKIIDDGGCTMDSEIVETPKYVKGQLKAFAEATVFKWPDEPSIYFSCQLTLCMVEDDGCLSVSPPRCGAKRAKRASERLNVTSENRIPIQTSISAINPPGPLKSFDLEVQKLVVLDLEEKPDTLFMSENRRLYFNGTTEPPKATTEHLEFHTVPLQENKHAPVETTVPSTTERVTQAPIKTTTPQPQAHTRVPKTSKLSDDSTGDSVTEKESQQDIQTTVSATLTSTTVPMKDLKHQNGGETDESESGNLNQTVNREQDGNSTEISFAPKTNENDHMTKKRLNENSKNYQRNQQKADSKRDFIHETLSRNRDLFGAKYCYGPEIVISFAVVVSILAAILLVLTGRILGPILKRRYATGEAKTYNQQQNNPYYTNNVMTYPI